jgi:hypothetical protein
MLVRSSFVFSTSEGLMLLKGQHRTLAPSKPGCASWEWRRKLLNADATTASPNPQRQQACFPPSLPRCVGADFVPNPKSLQTSDTEYQHIEGGYRKPCTSDN